MKPALEFYIAGYQFSDVARARNSFRAATVEVGTHITMTAEPENQADKQAIGLWVPVATGQLRIGYVPRDLTATVRNISDRPALQPWFVRPLPTRIIKVDWGAKVGKQLLVGVWKWGVEPDLNDTSLTAGQTALKNIIRPPGRRLVLT